MHCSHIWYLCFWKETIQEKFNVVVFPFAFHVALQQSFKPLWSRLLLYELGTISSIICSVLQVATDDAASGISCGVSLRLMPTLWPVQPVAALPLV
jgi:hypothetical protein